MKRAPADFCALSLSDLGGTIPNNRIIPTIYFSLRTVRDFIAERAAAAVKGKWRPIYCKRLSLLPLN